MLKFCPNLHFMYRELPFLDRFAAARADGFAAVEMTFPYDVPAPTIRDAADSAGVAIVEFNSPAGPIVTGVRRGLAAVPGHEAEYLDQILQGIAYARAFDCRLLLTLAGVVLAEADRPTAQRTFVSNLKIAAALCGEAGITLLIETNNLRDNPNYFLRRLDEVREVMALVGSPHLRAIFDFYHVQINEGDVSRRFAESLDLIAHIQLANPPDRNEPGAGELDFDHVFRLIAASGYAGWVGLEYFPKAGDTGASLGWMRERGFLPPKGAAL
ncbi:MAG: TIM barrel protein [Bauldia sp.]